MGVVLLGVWGAGWAAHYASQGKWVLAAINAYVLVVSLIYLARAVWR